MEHIAKLAERHSEALERLSVQLATNFDDAAPRLINRALESMGISRVEYEQIVAIKTAGNIERDTAA